MRSVSLNESKFCYTIFKYPREDIEWFVTFDQDKLYFGCSRKRFETLGICCKQLISVLIYLNIVKICE